MLAFDTGCNALYLSVKRLVFFCSLRIISGSYCKLQPAGCRVLGLWVKDTILRHMFSAAIRSLCFSSSTGKRKSATFVSPVNGMAWQPTSWLAIAVLDAISPLPDPILECPFLCLFNYVEPFDSSESSTVNAYAKLWTKRGNSKRSMYIYSLVVITLRGK